MAEKGVLDPKMEETARDRRGRKISLKVIWDKDGEG